MIFIDTNHVIPLVNPRDHMYAGTLSWVRAIHEPLLVTEYVLWEIVNALSALPSRPKAQPTVAELRGAPDCTVVPASTAAFEAGLRLHAERPDKEWSLTDCISFLVMQERGIQRALTYDHHFEQAGFEALLRHDPP